MHASPPRQNQAACRLNQIIKIDFKYNDYIVNDFYLTYKSMLLTKVIAESVSKDLSKVDYSPVVKKLYR